MRELPRKDVDFLVIGSGAAGAICARDMAMHGHVVQMVGVGTSATEMSSGCIRFNDDITLQKEIGLSEEGIRDARVEVERFLRQGLKGSGLNLIGTPDHHIQLYQGQGTMITENIVPVHTFAGNVGEVEGHRIGVIGFEGQTDFDAKLFSRSLSQRAEVHVEHRTIKMTGSTSQKSFVPSSIDMLSEAAKGTSGELIFVPPFLSLRHFEAGWAELERRSGRIFAEPVMNLGLPGTRLREALTYTVSRAGVGITNGASIIGMSIINGTLNEATVRSGHGLQRIRCKAAVFCGGGLVGGGLGISGRDVVDPLGIFDVRSLTDHDYQDIVRGVSALGLRTDGKLAAFVKGERIRNLFVAGAALPGMNIVAGNGMGDAMITAFIASRSAMEASS